VDIQLVPVDLGGVRGELSAAPGSDASRMLLFFHGGYCSGSIVSLDASIAIISVQPHP